METLTVVKDLGIIETGSGYRKRFCIVKCACGKLFEAAMNSINSGNTKSCGCGFFKKLPLENFPAYTTFRSMKSRCYRKNNQYYHLYGGRGITICQEWLDNPRLFLEWSKKNGYKKGMYIDRRDPDGNYEPSNCRFVDSSTNAQNTRLLSSSNSSGFRGVSKHIRMNGSVAWRSRITVFGKIINLGVYLTKQQAAKAFDEYVKKNKTDHPTNFN